MHCILHQKVSCCKILKPTHVLKRKVQTASVIKPTAVSFCPSCYEDECQHHVPLDTPSLDVLSQGDEDFHCPGHGIVTSTEEKLKRPAGNKSVEWAVAQYQKAPA
jgi:hypothetical protein